MPRPNRGAKIVPIRIPADLLAKIDQAVADSLQFAEWPHTRTSFILAAVKEVFKHRERALYARKRRQAKKQEQLLPHPDSEYLDKLHGKDEAE